MEKIIFNSMLSRIQKEIIKNKEEIEKLEKIDLKYCKIKIDIQKFVEIIENYKNKNTENIEKKITVFCNGNPYIVLNIAMTAVIKNIDIRIDIDDTMLGVNKYILAIINNILKANNLKMRIDLTDKFEDEDLIFIDRINDFNLIKRTKENIKFIPCQSVDIYSEDSKFEDLYKKIYNYAIDMNMDIDIFEDEGIETMLKYGTGNIKIILTDNTEIKEKYSGENIYINENPFKDKVLIFDDNIINNFK